MRYWWPGLYCEVEEFVKTYKACQKRKPGQVDEELHPTIYSALSRKVGLDVVHMPRNAGFKYFVAMRDDFSGWLEAKAIRNADAKTIAAFICEWFVRFGVPGRIVFDGGGQNKAVARELMKRHNARNVPIAAYHSQLHGLIERGHQPIIDALAKLGPHLVEHLPAVLWADQITTRRSTRFALYKLVFG